MALIIIIALIVIVALYFISTHNRFVTLLNQAEEASSQIDAHLKQRYDLVPNLVETVKGYAKHESQTLENVINARNRMSGVISSGTTAEKDSADRQLSGALKSLFALSESYPDLKANTGFTDLQKSLASIEADILSARKYYNAVVKTFNTAIQTFPNSIVASLGGGKFTKLAYLDVAEEEKQNVKVSF